MIIPWGAKFPVGNYYVLPSSFFPWSPDGQGGAVVVVTPPPTVTDTVWTPVTTASGVWTNIT